MIQRFISLEGIDGAGKSTHVNALAAFLRAQGERVFISREPGGSELAEKLRDLLLHQAMGTLTELLLVFAARNDHLERAIRPALADGQWVVCDRFTDASWAYQGAGRGASAAQLSWLESQVHGDLQPSRTYWFDLDPGEAARRRAASRGFADRFESQDLSFFERVREGYERRSQQRLGAFLRIDASLDAQSISKLLLEDLRQLWSSTVDDHRTVDASRRDAGDA